MSKKKQFERLFNIQEIYITVSQNQLVLTSETEISHNQYEKMKEKTLCVILNNATITQTLVHNEATNTKYSRMSLGISIENNTVQKILRLSDILTDIHGIILTGNEKLNMLYGCLNNVMKDYA